jgi:hypothetical protein
MDVGWDGIDGVTRAIARVFALAGAISACGDDGSSPVDDDPSDPSTTSTSATTSSTSTTTSDSDSTSGSDTTSSESSSTGGEELCGITEDPDQPGPWFELRNFDVVVADGTTLVLECGGQGSLMFYLRSTQGGFVPEGETAYYSVTLDVPGFDDLSPTGHFFQDPNAGVDVGCAAADEFEGGFSLDGVAVIPPDALLDPTMVDGLPGMLHVELQVPGGTPVVLDAAVTLEVAPEMTPENCSFG